jgi:hypothetical protein
MVLVYSMTKIKILFTHSHSEHFHSRSASLLSFTWLDSLYYIVIGQAKTHENNGKPSQSYSMLYSNRTTVVSCAAVSIYTSVQYSIQSLHLFKVQNIQMKKKTYSLRYFFILFKDESECCWFEYPNGTHNISIADLYKL